LRPSFGQGAFHYPAIVEAVAALHKSMPLYAFHAATCGGQTHAQPFGDSAHRRRTVLAQQEQESHLAEGEFLVHPIGCPVGVLCQHPVHRFDDGLDQNLSV
jgi:hypothetical protein